MKNIETLWAISLGNLPFTVNNLTAFLQNMSLIMPLMNALPNATFFIKDTDARYQLVNDALVKRCRLNHVKQILGKRAEDVFHVDLGLGYTEQDHDVMQKKRQICSQLELHSYKSGALGWCLTTKVPLLNTDNQVIGVAGISLDLQDEKFISPHLNAKLNRVEKYICQHFHSIIKVQDLAHIADLSISQFDRQFKNIFQMTPQQYIQKKRLEYAIELLANNLSITDIASQCGYTDHSAFSRKFKELTTMTPSQFKKQMH